MSAVAIPLTGAKEGRREKPTTTPTPALQDTGKVNHIDGGPMTKAEREELAELREMVHQLVATATLNAKVQPQAASNNSKWFMAAIATITILGSAGSFIGNSGMWVGKRDQENTHTTETVKELKDEVANLRTWNEKLRNNMAAYGWLIDSSGEVSRIEQKKRR